MRLTTKGRYGVRAVAYLACARAHSSSPVSISQIATEEEISPEFLEQIFFKLKRAGIIRSLRGPRGGFLLNQEPAEISVKSILDAVGEGLFPVHCVDPADSCARRDICCTVPVWQRLHGLMADFLTSVTLQDIIDNEPKARLSGLGADPVSTG